MDAIIEMYQQKKNKKEIKQTQDREILQKPITSFTILSIWPEALSKMGGKKKKDPENVSSVQVSKSIPHGFSFSEERKFFNLNHHQRHKD